jgi:hypothetical protein
MFPGIISLFSKGLAGSRGLTKIGLGMNPNQPFELRNWLHQFFQDLLQGGGGGGGMSSARSEGQSSGAAQSVMDNNNRMAQQAARRN